CSVHMFFFVDCSLQHLCLHSFPTRRSSDLKRARRFAAIEEVLTTTDSGPRSWSLSKAVSKNGAMTLTCQVRSYPSTVRTAVSKRDRKSTRLNSSHVSISYAVFCLKKKKQNA